VVASRQLAALGLTRQAIAKRACSGRLHPVHRGVFVVGQPRLTRSGTLFAAVLTAGDGAVVSHVSAAVLHGMWKGRQPRVVHVTVPPTGGRKRRRGLIVHRSPLRPDEVGTIDLVPVTSPLRTIVDLADMATPRDIERTLDEADYLGIDLDGLEPRRGRAGCGRLAAVLADHDVGSTLTRSELEEWLLAFTRRHGIDRPAVNAWVEGYEVDFSWPNQRLIVEADGRQSHDTRRGFEQDRARDAALVVAGWRVIRVTRQRLRKEEQLLDTQLRKLLS
jgi:very-short-patch-repair endonuclease